MRGARWEADADAIGAALNTHDRVLRDVAILAVVFDRVGHYEPAAAISAFAADSFTLTANPELNTAITHLREVLGDEFYESFARAGESMTNAAMATYAFDQIDQPRAHLT